MSKQLRLDVAQLTDVGRKRPHNEDNMAHIIPRDEQALLKKGALFIVADGMGGHAAGEVASEIAVDTVSKAYYEDDSEDISVSLIHAIKRANAIIHQRAAENMLRSGMGTTCVAASIRGNMIYVANVGDSRAYIVRNGRVRQISQDHSWVEEQVRAGLLTRDQARSHAQRNVITRSLGTQSEVEVDVFSEPIEEGDTIILCTDGLSGAVIEDDLRAIVNQYLPQESVYHLVERANENGGADNITAIVIRVQEVRSPVSVGGREANENTVVFGRTSTSSLSSSAQTEDSRIPGSPLPVTTNPLAPTESTASSHPSSVAKAARRSRLLYPTLALSILLVLALIGGGIYYFFYTNATVDNELINANQLIHKADTLADRSPVDALKQLVSAQHSLQRAHYPLLFGDQAARLTTLEGSWKNSLVQASKSYNKQGLVNVLPCSATPGGTLDTKSGNIALQPIMLGSVQDGAGKVSTYALASNNKVYLVDDQHHLTAQHSVADDQQMLLLASNGQHLFALIGKKDANGRLQSIMVDMLTQDGSPLKLKDELSKQLPTNLLNDGWTPKFLAASGNNVYVALTSSTHANQAKFFAYTVDHWQDNPVSDNDKSVSPDIVSVAALPDQQVALLTSDSHVKIFKFAGDGNASLPTDVPLQKSIPTPLIIDSTHFTSATPLATPTSSSSTSIAPANALLLVSGSIEGSQHLYIFDNTNHRILDLKLFTQQTSTQNAGQSNGNASSEAPGGKAIENTPTLQLVQQYALANPLSSVKNMVVDATGKQLYLLSQDGKNLTIVPSLDKVLACNSPS